MQLPDPFKDYQESIEQYQKAHPELLEFSRIAYKLFLVDEDGKKLIKLLEERYLQQSLVDPTAINAPHLALYWTGFTDCIKSLKRQALEHKQRIEAV